MMGAGNAVGKGSEAEMEKFKLSLWQRYWPVI
jgi:hypothetical protein